MEKNTILEKQLTDYAVKARKRYQAEYRKKHPETVAEWRKQAIINAYIKLVQAEPERAVRI